MRLNFKPAERSNLPEGRQALTEGHCLELAGMQALCDSIVGRSR